MFLLHSTLNKYRTLSLEGKRRAMRCLKELTGFLLAEDAVSYVPKVLSSVNIGMAEPDPETRCHAVKALRGFVEVLCGWEEPSAEVVGAVGGVMSDIVVAVFPVFGPEDESSHTREAREEARFLIEYLVDGPLGKSLQPYFGAIPFLPPHPTLDAVRLKLASCGHDLDALSASTCDADDDSDGRPGQAAAAAALVRKMRERTAKLADLAGHENVRVRRAVLSYLTTLVAGHRRLFKKVRGGGGGGGQNGARRRRLHP